MSTKPRTEYILFTLLPGPLKSRWNLPLQPNHQDSTARSGKLVTSKLISSSLPSSKTKPNGIADNGTGRKSTSSYIQPLIVKMMYKPAQLIIGLEKSKLLLIYYLQRLFRLVRSCNNTERNLWSSKQCIQL